MYNIRTMAKELRVLFLAAEAVPYIKIGGLGDVASSLPLAINALNGKESGETEIDIRIVLPFHPVLRSKALAIRPIASFTLEHDNGAILVQAFETSLEGVPVYFIGGGPIDASGSVYSSDAVLDGEKYTFFSLAALELTRQIGWHPDILHANDWHTALALYGSLVQFWQEGSVRPATLITLHNLPYMGPDVDFILQAYQIPLAQTDLPNWARKKPLPLGLWAADKIVAVSPTYAQEILTPEYIFGNPLCQQICADQTKRPVDKPGHSFIWPGIPHGTTKGDRSGHQRVAKTWQSDLLASRFVGGRRSEAGEICPPPCQRLSGSYLLANEL